MFHRIHRLALPCATAFCLTGGLAVSAHAQAVTVERALSCNVPLIGVQPATLTIDADLPSTAPPGATIAGNFDWTIRLGGQTYRGFKTIGVSTYQVADPRFVLDLAIAGTSTSAAIAATGTSAPTQLAEQDPGDAIGVPLVVDGQLTPKALPGDAGDATLSLRSTFNFQLLAKDADGKLIDPFVDDDLPQPDIERPDGLPVTCKLATGADATIHAFEIVPPPTDDEFAFDLTGATTLKSLVSGTVPLTGSLEGTAAPGGEITGGQLSLDPAQAKLKALGFVPVTAKLQFVAAGALSGSVGNANLSTPWVEQSFRVKLPEIRVFGVQIGGGQNCQTRSATKIKLTAGGPVLSAPQTLTGTYALSNLSGCGALNGLVSQATASTGNLMRLSLQAPTTT